MHIHLREFEELILVLAKMASESSWLSWVKMENQEMMITFPIDRHIRAVGWSLAMIAFGFLILAFDTRPIPPRLVRSHAQKALRMLDMRCLKLTLLLCQTTQRSSSAGSYRRNGTTILPRRSQWNSYVRSTGLYFPKRRSELINHYCRLFWFVNCIC